MILNFSTRPPLRCRCNGNLQRKAGWSGQRWKIIWRSKFLKKVSKRPFVIILAIIKEDTTRVRAYHRELSWCREEDELTSKSFEQIFVGIRRILGIKNVICLEATGKSLYIVKKKEKQHSFLERDSFSFWFGILNLGIVPQPFRAS